MSSLRRLFRRSSVLAVLTGAASALALGALNQAAHPGTWGARLLWASGGLLAAALAVVLAGRGKEPAAS